ncbi:MAG: Ig-like domain-containing protein [Candidatus Thiodiazotropha endolucinida]
MRRRRSKKRSNALICEELEPRILLSADLVGVAVDPASNEVEQQVDETELQTIEAGLQSVLSNQTDESDISTRELVIIDPATPDYQCLVDDLISQNGNGRSFEIVLLDSSANGIEQLNETLAQYQGLNAIHLISHGGEGEIRLGDATLNQDGLQQSAEQISAWGEALNPGGDWLIYGCDIASTATGERFIEQFAALTGADVAASNDVTGHETLGGDWDPEVVEGSIETDVAVGNDGQEAWLNRLDTTTGLLGHWTLDSNAADSSGNSHNGTLTNGASIDNPGSSNPIGGGNLNLDGFNDFVQLNTHVSAFSDLSEGTIAAWINTSYSGAQAMFSITDTADYNSLVVFGMDNGRIFFDLANNNFYSLSVETNASYADGNWHHVAVTVDGSGNSIYIDGVEVSLAGLFYRDGNSSTSSFISSVTSLDSMAIGNLRDPAGYTGFFNGLQDDVRVYDRALSASDITELISNTAPTYDAAGPPSFTAHTITSAANGAASVTTVDMDGDGDLDVVSASQNDNKIAWYENDGSQNFTAQTISTSASGAFAVTTADVDGDGDMDVLSASITDDKIAWYENDGNENFTTHTITLSADIAASVAAADVDDDGDIDVLSASVGDDRVVWYENDGNENFTTHTVTTSATEARQVIAADVDGDGDLDLLSASRSSDKLAWYENDGFENFTLHTITAAAGPVSAVAAADIDGDGDLDVISASYTDDNVVWFENDGSENFTANTIASVTGEAFSVAVADMDGDGDVDVLATDDAADAVTWYENVMSVTTLDGAPTFVEDGAAVVLDADVNVSDAELDALNSGQGDYNGASLTLVRNGAANSDDVFSFNDGNGITLSGSNLIKSSQIIASFDTTSTAGELVITFTNANSQTPTSADVDNILRQITYSNSNDAPPASVQIDWTFDDGNTGSQGSGGALQAVGSTTVTITAVNDDLTNAGSLPTDITVAENVSSNVDLSAVDFSDVDAGVGTLTVTLTTSTGGNLSAAAGTGITIGGTSTARTLTGTLTDLNNYFNTASNITYLHGTPDTNGDDADTINITINDNGNTGTGGGTNINLGTVNVDITPDNEVPTITNLGGDSLAYSEDDGAQVIDQGTASIVADVDSSDFDTGTLTVSFQAGSDNAEDVLAIRDQDAGPTNITVSGSAVSYGGTQIGTFTGGSSGTNLVITLDADADATAVTALVRNITYENTDIENPTTGARTVRFVLTDGDGGTSVDYDTTVTVSTVNDPPTLAATAANDTLTENTDTTSGAVFATVTIDPIEAGDDIASAQLTLGGGIDNSDTLTINGTAISGLGSNSSGAITGGHSYSYTQATGVVTITFAASTNAAAAELVLESITYGIDPADQNPSTIARTITLNTVTDNGGGSDTSSDIGETATISVGAVNDNPTNAGSLPSDISVTEDVSSNIDLSAIDFADVDAASGTLTVTLTTSTGGDLSAAAGTGITIGGTSSALTLTGTLTDLNNYFNTASNITYLHGTTNTAGNDADTINVTINDNGNTGSGGGTNINLGTVNVDITAVNDDPSNAGSLPSDISVTEDVSSNVDLSAVDFADVDAASGTLTVTLTTSTGGDLTAAAGTGITIGGTSTARTLTGTLTDLNNYFNTASNITYLHGTTNTAGNDADTINVTINDNGNTGTGGGTNINMGTVNVDITAVNDPPTLAATAANDTLTENTDTTSGAVFATVTIDPIEAGDDIASAQLTLGGGIDNSDTLTINGTAISGLGSNSSGAISGGHSYSYTQATGVVTINFAGGTNAATAELVLESITYGIDPADQNPSTTARTVTLNTVTDNGGGSDTSSDIGETATISVGAVNDNPTNAGSLPSDISVTEDVSSNIDLSAIDFADVDAASGTLTVTLTTSTGGDLSAAAGTGITIGGTSTALTLTGTLSDLNNYFNTASNITYLHGTANTNGNDADTINVTINDNGNTGSGGGTNINLGTVNVDIAAVNDDPSNAGSLPSDISVTEDVSSNADLSAVDFSDDDAGASTLTVTLTTSTGGDLTAAAGTGITIGGTSTARTLTGTLSDLNNYFNTASNITYLHGTANTNGNDADTINVTINDNGNTGSGGGTNINLGTVNVDIAAVNDDPSNAGSLPSDISVTEDVSSNVDLSAVDFADVDAASGTLTVTLTTSTGGDLSAAAGTGITIGGTSTALTLTGTLTDLNNYFNTASNITYLHGTANTAGDNADTIQVDITDNGNTGTGGGGAINLGTVNVDITAVNDAPVVVDLDGDIHNFTEGDGVVLIEQGGDAVVSDSDSSDYAGGSLTVEVDSGLQSAEDRFSIFNQGTDTGEIGLSGGNVTYSGTLIGTVTGGTGIDPLTVTFNSNATSAAVTALVRNITYENSNLENPTDGTRSVTIDISDGDGGTSLTQNLTLNVSSVNDAPVVDLNGADGAGEDFAATFTEGGGAVNVVDTDATISDVDNTTYQNLSINLSGFLDGVSEQITIAGYVFTYGTSDNQIRTVGSTDFEIDFDGTGFNVMLDGGGGMPEADLQSLLRGVTYENTSQDPTAGDRTINFFAQDSSLLNSPVATSTITVNPQNDAPTATDNANSVSENGFVSGNVITDDSGSGVDSDPEGDGLQVTQVEGGAYTPGLPVTLASGAQVTFQSNGSYTYNTNGQFDGLGAGSSVDDNFTYQIGDGNGGFDTATVTITINGSNNAPVITSAGLTLDEGQTVTLGVANFAVSDADDTDFTYTVSGISGGYFQLSTNPGVSITSFTSANLTGGLVQFVDDGNEVAPAFSVTVNDGDIDSNTLAATINFTLVSDSTPVANIDSITVAEGGTVTTLVGGASTVLNNDTGLVDAPVTVSLVSDVTNGSLTLNGDGTFSYTHDGSENFTDSFTYRITDNDGQTADATVTINVTPVSDATPVANADSITVAEGATATILVGGSSTVLNNDTGLGDTPVTVSLVTDVTNGTLTLNGDGTFSYTHDGSENFTDSFTYRVTDNDGQTADATVTINVTPVSDATPVANADSITVAEGATATTLVGGSSTVLNNDTGLGDTPVTVSLVTDVTNGSLTLNGDGTFSYTHDGSENFTDSFTYRVTDNDGQTADATVTINVTPVSDATPVANADSITVAEGGTITTLVGGSSTVLNNDTGLGDTPVTVSLVTDVTNGSLTLNGDGTFSYTHDGSENFTDSFTYRVTDNDGETADATVTINVTPVSDATPVANADSITVAEGGTITTLVGGSSTVLNNDTGLGDTPVTVSLVTDVTNGSLTLNGDGTFSYTHDGSENFTDSFTYRVTDNDGQTADATVTINITPVSDQTPVANADSITVAEGATATTLVGGSSTVLNNDTGLGDTPVMVSLVTDVTNGSLTLNGDGTFSYTHDGSENFTDSFTYRVTDNDGETADATVTINVTPVSDATPVANADSITVAEGATATTLVGGSSTVLNNDTGLGDTPVTVSLVTDVTNGTLTLNTDGTFSYTHDGSENFTDSFTYRVTNNDGETADATVTINITPVSDATPVANADSITVAEGATATTLVGGSSTVLNNDTGLGDTPVTVSLVTDVTNGSLTLSGDGTFSYTHDGSENFTDSFTYRVTDNDGETADATVTINITPVSDATPVANADSITVAEGATATTLVGGSSTVLNNDTGLGDTPVTVSLVTDVTNGTLTLNGDGTFSYTHDGSENFTDSFTYRVTDNDGETADATVTINITPVSDQTPVANADSITVAEGATATTLVGGSSTVLNNDTGLGDTPVIVSLITNVTNGSLTLNGDGTFSYTHDGSENFTDSFTYRITDNDGETADATVTINVTPVSDTTPVANADSITVAEGATATTLVGGSSTVLNNDTGLGDTPVIVSLITNVTNGSLTLNGDGTFSYTHDGSENFTDSFTYRVTDNDGETADATVTINVTPVSDETPVANTDSITVAEGATATTLVGGSSTVLNNDTGLGDTPVIVSLITNVTNGSLTLNGDGTFSYTHDGSENFTDSFTYRITDNDGETADATVTINITPVSDQTPVANADSITVAEGATATTLVGGSSTVLNNDTGLSDTPVTVSLITDVTNGILTLNSDGTFSYTHDGSENFTDSFTYRVTDNDGETADATVTINVISNNNPPEASDTNISVLEDNVYTGNLPAAVDGDGDTVTYRLDSNPVHGSITLDMDGGFSYTPDADYHGADSFIYSVSDGNGGNNSYLVEIDVVSVNDSPVITSHDENENVLLSLEENATLVTMVTADDPENDAISFAIDGGADLGLFSIDPISGEMVFTHAPDMENPLDADQDNLYQVQVLVSDGNGGTDRQSFTIEVTDVDEFDVGLLIDVEDTPDAIPLSGSLSDGVGITVWAEDPDSSNNRITYSLDDDSNGLFAIDPASGTITLASTLDNRDASQFEITVRATSEDGSYSLHTFHIAFNRAIDTTPDPEPPYLDDIIFDLDPEEPVESQATTDKTGPLQRPPTDADTVSEELSSEDQEASLSTGIEERTRVIIEDIERPAIKRLSPSLFPEDSRNSYRYDYYQARLTPLPVAPEELPVFDTSIGELIEVPEAIWHLLDSMNSEMSEHQREQVSTDRITVQTATFGTLALSAGYVAWLLRAGVLSASLLSFTPLWRQIDPLPVLSAHAKRRDEDQDHPPEEDPDEKRLAKLFDRKKKPRKNRFIFFRKDS